jgi:hypothetical protein
VLDDDKGRSFSDRRDEWREGSDFAFTAEFFATQNSKAVEEDEEDIPLSLSMSSDDSDSDSDNRNIIDTEIVQ